MKSVCWAVQFRPLQVLVITSVILSAAACAPGASELSEDNAAGLQTLRITGPFQKMIYERSEDLFDVQNRKFESEYQNVTVEFGGETLKAKIKLRGGIRFCDGFPHFTLKLRGDRTLFGGEKFKIVSPGSYDRDYSIPVRAPACGDELANRPPGSDYRGEYLLYKLQSEFTSKHLQTIPLMISYQDETTAEVVTGFSFLIEDFSATLLRYDAEDVDFGPVNESVSWRETDDEEIRNSIMGDEYYRFLADEYKKIEAADPGLSVREISDMLPKPADVQVSPAIMAVLNSAVDSRFPGVKAGLKSEQAALLQDMDINSALESLLYEVLVGNSDWALFGLNDHPAGHRNLKFMLKGGRYHVAAYDFDLAAAAEGRVVSAADYEASLSELNERIKEAFPDDGADEFVGTVARYREKIQSLIASGTSMPSTFVESMKNFLIATSP